MRPRLAPLKPKHGKVECNLLKMRMVNKITARDMESYTGISSSTLYDLEMGADCRLTTAKKLTEYFECRIEDIWPN